MKQCSAVMWVGVLGKSRLTMYRSTCGGLWFEGIDARGVRVWSVVMLWN